MRRGLTSRSRRGRPAGGFTLVEVVLVLVIAAVSLLPLSMLFATASIRSGDAHNATIAAQLAEAKMEEITADKSSPTRGFAYLVPGNYPAESPIPAFPGYSRSVSIAPDSVYDGVTFRTVRVTVTSPNIPPITLTTWFTRY
jgi:prepilin-type N-terminal cleavage/methylation domain-containing protein